MRSELVEKAVSALRARGETMSFAESCTGGLLSSMCTALAGVSDVYIGSVIAYSNAVKENVLGVPATQLKSVGAVSVPVAKSMALGLRSLLKTTWTISITGIAGPGGGTPQKPVGTVCFGVVGPGVERVVQMQFTGSRSVIQQASADYALKLLLEEVGAST